jgi:hypothetical protein
MLVAAGGAPVTMKRRAVNRSTKVRTPQQIIKYLIIRAFGVWTLMCLAVSYDLSHVLESRDRFESGDT